MTEEYRYALKAHLGAYGVYYWDIGGVIFLRTLPFLDGGESFNQSNGIHNAQFKAAWSLSSEHYINSFIGRPIAGKIYRVPDYVKAVQGYDHHGCVFMYAVVTGGSTPPKALKASILPSGKALPDIIAFAAIIVIVPLVAGAVIRCEIRPRDRRPDYRRVAQGAWVGFVIGGTLLWVLAMCVGSLGPIPG